MPNSIRGGFEQTPEWFINLEPGLQMFVPDCPFVVFLRERNNEAREVVRGVDHTKVLQGIATFTLQLRSHETYVVQDPYGSLWLSKGMKAAWDSVNTHA